MAVPLWQYQYGRLLYVTLIAFVIIIIIIIITSIWATPKNLTIIKSTNTVD